MNILIVAPEYPPRNIGGGGIVYKNLSKELKSNGHSVKVLAGSFTNKKIVGKVESSSESGVPVFFVPLLPSPKFKKFNASTYTLPALSAFPFITKQLLQSKNEIVHIQGLCHPMVDITALECMLMHKKYILTCHGVPKNPEIAGFPWKGLLKLYLLTIARTVMKNARAVTFVSRSLMKECCNRNLVNKNMTVVPNGPNRALVKANPKAIEKIERKYSLKDKHVIFAIGRLSPTKGFQHLIEAMQNVLLKLPEAVAIIAGTGPYKKDLEDLINQKGLSDHVKLIGQINEEEKAALYERSDAVVFPSLQEPFGLVILEAFTMHKPVVAFNTESALEMINDKTDGLLVPIKDNRMLADSIIQVLTDRGLREKIIANTNKIEAFRWEEIAKKYVNMYSKALAKE